MEGACHKRVVVRGIAEYHQLGTAEGIMVLVASAVSVTILPISSTASMSMPVLVEPTLTELHTRSVWDSAWGMERIRFLSALVMPLLTRRNSRR